VRCSSQFVNSSWWVSRTRVLAQLGLWVGIPAHLGAHHDLVTPRGPHHGGLAGSARSLLSLVTTDVKLRGDQLDDLGHVVTDHLALVAAPRARALGLGHLDGVRAAREFGGQRFLQRRALGLVLLRQLLLSRALGRRLNARLQALVLVLGHGLGLGVLGGLLLAELVDEEHELSRAHALVGLHSPAIERCELTLELLVASDQGLHRREHLSSSALREQLREHLEHRTHEVVVARFARRRHRGSLYAPRSITQAESTVLVEKLGVDHDGCTCCTGSHRADVRADFSSIPSSSIDSS
jgi:hypothetical protein